MRYDAGYYSADTFLPKFEKLLEHKYNHLKEHKRRNAFINEYYSEFGGNIENTVKQWFAGTQKPSIEKLMNICELFDCDIDYFLTEQIDFKKDIAGASEITGLPYASVELLQKQSTSTDTQDNFVFQALKKVLSSKEYYEQLFSFIAFEIFQVDTDEQGELESTFENAHDYNEICNDEKYALGRDFLDAINFRPYHWKYDNRLYLPNESDSESNNEFSSTEYISNSAYAFMELGKMFHQMQLEEKEYRKKYKGNVIIVLPRKEDYDKYWEDNHEELYIARHDTSKVNKNIDIIFEDYYFG